MTAPKAPPKAPRPAKPVPGSVGYRRVTARRIAYSDTVILALAITGVVFLAWRLTEGETNLPDVIVALVTTAVNAAVTNARSSREYYFGSSANEEREQ